MVLLLKVNISSVVGLIRSFEELQSLPSTAIVNPIKILGIDLFMTLFMEEVFNRKFFIPIVPYQLSLSTVIAALEPSFPFLSAMLSQAADGLYHSIIPHLVSFINTYEDDKLRLLVFKHDLLVFMECHHAGKRPDEVAYVTQPCGNTFTCNALF